MSLPRNLRPIRLSGRLAPFNGADWIFEIKHDGPGVAGQILRSAGMNLEAVRQYLRLGEADTY